jgi:drug/metabolite transporter (DMT)-like permease
VFTEKIALHGILLESVPILYGGVCSVGIAYTLQVIGQKEAKPSHAAIILSMESMFACLGGILILGETMSLRVLVGCMLMITGIICSQLAGIRQEKSLLLRAKTLPSAESEHD